MSLSTGGQMRPTISGFNYRRLRGELAERMLTQTELARASGLNRTTVSYALTGRQGPGELARIKLERGLEQLGIDPAVAFGPTESKSVESGS